CSLLVSTSPPAVPSLSLHAALPIFAQPAQASHRPHRPGADRAWRKARNSAHAGTGIVVARGAQPRRRRALSARVLRRPAPAHRRSEEHTSELQSREKLVCRLLLGKK